MFSKPAFICGFHESAIETRIIHDVLLPKFNEIYEKDINECIENSYKGCSVFIISIYGYYIHLIHDCSYPGFNCRYDGEFATKFARIGRQHTCPKKFSIEKWPNLAHFFGTHGYNVVKLDVYNYLNIKGMDQRE